MSVSTRAALTTANYLERNGQEMIINEIVNPELLKPGGLATAFDLAAFRLSMIAPVKKSVNHSRTVASMRETDWEKQQEAHLRSD